MELMLAYCGLVCDTCPIHLATLEPDAGKRAGMRVDIARAATEIYQLPMTPEQVTDCDGCKAGGRLLAGCAECPIRPCALERGLDTCASCPEYACEELEGHFAHDPESRARLDAIRARRKVH